jgi:mono/diheme cytochrome c family protein
MMIKRLLHWTGVALGSLAVLAVVAYAIAYLLSERALKRSYHVPPTAMAIPTDPASILEGRRLASIRGCFGCHGQQGAGAVLFDQPMIARIVAPNLTAAVRRYSDAELVGVIRNGVRPGGRSMLVMPAEAFGVLTDEDLGRIIAFLKSLPPSKGPGGGVSIGPLGRIGLAIGQYKTVAQLIAETVPPPEPSTRGAVHGRYLARTICVQCHGTSLHGASTPDYTSPNLQIVAAYTPAAFAQLLRTGVALGGRSLPLMSPWARNYLSQLTDEEIADLYSYLRAMPDAPRT